MFTLNYAYKQILFILILLPILSWSMENADQVVRSIYLLQKKINALLDQEEADGKIRHEDPCCTTPISEFRTQDDRPKNLGIATKQGLLLVYHTDRPLFKLISPAGQQILAGYQGMCGVMAWDDYDYVKKELLSNYLGGQHCNQVCGKTDFWRNCKAYKIDSIEWQPLPVLDYEFSNNTY